MNQSEIEIEEALRAGQHVVEIKINKKRQAIGRTDYNKPSHVELPAFQAESLARVLLPFIQDFFSHKTNQEEYENWLTKQNHNKDALT